MKIFFEDGELETTYCVYQILYIDACKGPTENRDFLNYIQQNPQYYTKNTIIYTNSLIALNNKYCWDEELQTPKLYFRDKSGEWRLARDLTKKEICKEQDLMMMYLKGEFNI